jgi:hypothetical protein
VRDGTLDRSLAAAGTGVLLCAGERARNMGDKKAERISILLNANAVNGTPLLQRNGRRWHRTVWGHGAGRAPTLSARLSYPGTAAELLRRRSFRPCAICCRSLDGLECAVAGSPLPTPCIEYGAYLKVPKAPGIVQRRATAQERPLCATRVQLPSHLEISAAFAGAPTQSGSASRKKVGWGAGTAWVTGHDGVSNSQVLRLWPNGQSVVASARCP